MSRRTLKSRAAKSVAVAPAATPAQLALPGDMLAQLAQLLSSIQAAPSPAPAASPAPVKATPVKAAKAKRDFTPISDTSVRKAWISLDDSVVKRQWARLGTVKFDTVAQRFRAPTTQERRAGNGGAALISASAVLEADAALARLASLGLCKPGATTVLVRNAHAGIELSMHSMRGKLAIAARRLDNGPLGTAPRIAKLAITNLLNALLPA